MKSLFLASFVPLLAAGCSGLIPHTTGSVQSSKQSLPVAMCSSGDPRNFLGVDLIDDRGQPLIRVVEDPLEGTRMRYHGAGAPAGGVILDRRSCRVLTATVEPSGWRANNVRVMQGRLHFDCDLPDGVPVSGEIAFEGCG